jgi:hypothetical protein
MNHLLGERINCVVANHEPRFETWFRRHQVNWQNFISQIVHYVRRLTVDIQVHLGIANAQNVSSF